MVAGSGLVRPVYSVALNIPHNYWTHITGPLQETELSGTQIRYSPDKTTHRLQTPHRIVCQETETNACVFQTPFGRALRLRLEPNFGVRMAVDYGRSRSATELVHWLDDRGETEAQADLSNRRTSLRF